MSSAKKIQGAGVAAEVQDGSVLTALLVSIASGIGSLVALLRSATDRRKALDEKAAADQRMREIAETVMNPRLQEERHEELTKKVDNVVTIVTQTLPTAVRDAALAGVQAGYRMMSKKRDVET